MNVVVANEQQEQISTLDIDIIKSTTGTYEANEIIEMFKNFFYNKMVLDVTAIKDYNSIQTFRVLSQSLDVDKIVFFIPEGSSLCTPNFLSKLVTLGIYNFTTNIEGVKYLIAKSNTYKDVEDIQKMGGGIIEDELLTSSTEKSSSETEDKEIQQAEIDRKIIGVKNITDHAGSTSLIYMMKKELVSVFGESKVIAIEINKHDLQFYSESGMISTDTNEVRSIINKYKDASIILIDVNDYEDLSICDDVLYLVEPSTLKLNKLVRRDSNIFTKLKDKKIILNKSLLPTKDITELEYEAHIKVFYNMPAVNDRKRNESITELLAKLELIEFGEKEDSNRIFGLFRR